MKQIVFILKEKKGILVLCACLFAFTSCYKIESLPDRIKSNYELAIPVVDTTFEIGDFIDHTYPDPDDYPIEIPANTPINIGEISYPFYIGDYSAQEVEWIEPQLIMDAKDFHSGAVLNISIYTEREDETKNYFWLPEDHPVTLTSASVKIPDAPVRITNIEQLKSARKVYMDISLTYPVPVSVSDILHDRINIKFAIKFAIKTDLTIKL